jgi:hypothetical protein
MPSSSGILPLRQIENGDLTEIVPFPDLAFSSPGRRDLTGRTPTKMARH